MSDQSPASETQFAVIGMYESTSQVIIDHVSATTGFDAIVKSAMSRSDLPSEENPQQEIDIPGDLIYLVARDPSGAFTVPSDSGNAVYAVDLEEFFGLHLESIGSKIAP